MVMIVGADVNSDEAVVVLVDDSGAIAVGLPEKLKPSPEADDAVRLSEFMERVRQHLRAVKADAVVLTDVDRSRARPSSVRYTTQIETVITLAAHAEGAAVEVVHQKSIGKHLGLSANASKKQIRDVLEDRVGTKALSPDPDRRARALGAALSVLERHKDEA